MTQFQLKPKQWINVGYGSSKESWGTLTRYVDALPQRRGFLVRVSDMMQVAHSPVLNAAPPAPESYVFYLDVEHLGEVRDALFNDRSTEEMGQ